MPTTGSDKKSPEINPALFEILTAIAFLQFRDKQIDIAVLEVGLGGRLDSTNVIKAIVAVITNIDLEHTEILGKTKEKIATEKAGIIKSNSVVITGETNKKLLKIFGQIAKKNKSKFSIFKKNEISLQKYSAHGQIFNFKKYKNLEIPLMGQHQLLNSSLAVIVAESLQKKGFDNIDEKSIRQGLKNVSWPLRLEIVHQNPKILIDVGHNIHGIKAIKQSIDEIFKKSNKILILGCSYDKPYKQMAKTLSELSDKIILTKAKYHGEEIKELEKVLDKSGKTIYLTNNVTKALQIAKKIVKRNTLIMILGGLYLGAEARQKIKTIFR